MRLAAADEVSPRWHAQAAVHASSRCAHDDKRMAHSNQATQSAEDDGLDIPSSKMLVKTGTVSLGVEEVYFASAAQKIEGVMMSVGGDKAYIESQSSGKGHLRMTLRVPVETFEDAMSALEGLVGANGALGESGDVYEASKHAKDVTAEFVDRRLARKRRRDA